MPKKEKVKVKVTVKPKKKRVLPKVKSDKAIGGMVVSKKSKTASRRG